MDKIMQFKSVGAFSAYLAQGETQPAFKSNPSSQRLFENRRSRDCREFYNTLNYDEADCLFKTGDKKSMEKLQAATSTKLSAAGTGRTTEIVWGYSGTRPSVSRYFAGNPRCMMQVKKKVTIGRVMSVIYELNIPAYIDATTIADTSAKLVQAILNIEKSGIKINMYVSSLSYKEGTDIYGAVVKIKDSAQRFNLLGMAYSLIHPSMLRRHFFRWLEVTPGIPGSFAFGYGRCVKHEQLINATKFMRPDSAICFSDVHNKSVEEIEKIILKK